MSVELQDGTLDELVARGWRWQGQHVVSNADYEAWVECWPGGQWIAYRTDQHGDLYWSAVGPFTVDQAVEWAERWRANRVA